MDYLKDQYGVSLVDKLLPVGISAGLKFMIESEKIFLF